MGIKQSKSRISILNEVSKEYKQESYYYAIQHCLPGYVLNIALEAMKRYSSHVTKQAVTEMYKEKEEECESLRQTIRDICKNGK